MGFFFSSPRQGFFAVLELALSLCSFGTRSVDEVGLELKEVRLPLPLLVLKTCTTATRLALDILKSLAVFYSLSHWTALFISLKQHFSGSPACGTLLPFFGWLSSACVSESLVGSLGAFSRSLVPLWPSVVPVGQVFLNP